MNNLGVVLFSLGIGIVLTILAILFKNKIVSIIGGLIWILPGFYCFWLHFTSGDPDYGVFTLAFGWVAFMLSVFTFLVPTIFIEKNKGISDDKRSDYQIGLDNYKENIERHSQAIKATRSLGRRKRPDLY